MNEVSRDLSGDAVRAAKQALAARDYETVLQLLRESIGPNSPFPVQHRAARILCKVPAERRSGKRIRLGLLASSTVDHFVDVLRFWMGMEGFDAEIYVPPFDMVAQAVLDETSDLYAFEPEVIWIFTTERDLRITARPGKSQAELKQLVDGLIAETASLWAPLLNRLSCTVIQNNADIPAGDEFGNLSGTIAWGKRSLLRQYNVALTGAAPAGVTLFDLEHISASFGRQRWVDWRYWHHSKHAVSFDAVGRVAFMGSKLIGALKGQAKKCLIVDLDNTLWGGVVGDDGIEGIKLGLGADGEAFVAFQAYVKALKERGVILAVCSKNEEEVARAAFQNHPDMQLSLNDIAVFKANWNDKVQNIQEIADTLNIGLDSVVFVDDSPAERAIVRQFLPMVEVPELPEEPAEYVDAVKNGAYFEATSFSAEDSKRADYYRTNAQRAEFGLSFKDKADYLKSLAMVGSVGQIDPLHLPRVAQLINKSNQFHLTTTRYSQSEILALNADPNCIIRHFRLEDRFGDNGLISVLILRIDEDGSRRRALRIDTWVMSCRVLARSMEEFIQTEIFALAKQNLCASIIGVYKPTAKNKLVAGLYERLGYRLVHADEEGNSTWEMDVDDNSPSFITYVARGNPVPEGGTTICHSILT